MGKQCIPGSGLTPAPTKKKNVTCSMGHAHGAKSGYGGWNESRKQQQSRI